jgi:hypothetical protein
MPHADITAGVGNIMREFAEQTGVSSDQRPPRRYLWTDAHAVCNFLSLYRHTGDENYRRLAVMLIDQVHNVLGRHRDDDRRSGWISGLSEAEGSDHPTAGGLRIGKQLRERGRGEPFDERAEWERDGQYYHYLTKWMHALCRAAANTGDSRYCRWAAELARAAQAGFVAETGRGGKRRLLWKMSIDLTHPLVPSSGLHDPLDGHITFQEIAHCEGQFDAAAELPALDAEILDTAAMIETRHWSTDDPLGIGGLLFDACRVMQLRAAGQIRESGLAAMLVRDARDSLAAYTRQTRPGVPADYRLAFRELGLAIGLRAVATMRAVLTAHPGLFAGDLRRDLEAIGRHDPLRRGIESFWQEAASQRARSWLEHLDINRVMLATSLLPDEFLAV